MAADAKDVLSELPRAREVVVVLDDHHDSEVINSGLLERALTGMLRDEPALAEEDLHDVPGLPPRTSSASKPSMAGRHGA
ncbi:hypothetical protein [Saccharopolyspora erythraea]|uniref:Uncharacterized protein n=2 Tax=Saccharopolyspora erythraea TaxID=1836 RepID=A4FJT7_SACEN|nr:hypothetical protein N599_25700 [Saccharopolyspora erythraea D]CAM04312.1 hypothetical protein SACE_5052 [Saccharopolyspora erythraea NRRL 2338]